MGVINFNLWVRFCSKKTTKCPLERRFLLELPHRCAGDPHFPPRRSSCFAVFKMDLGNLLVQPRFPRQMPGDSRNSSTQKALPSVISFLHLFFSFVSACTRAQKHFECIVRRDCTHHAPTRTVNPAASRTIARLSWSVSFKSLCSGPPFRNRSFCGEFAEFDQLRRWYDAPAGSRPVPLDGSATAGPCPRSGHLAFLPVSNICHIRLKIQISMQSMLHPGLADQGANLPLYMRGQQQSQQPPLPFQQQLPHMLGAFCVSFFLSVSCS